MLCEICKKNTATIHIQEVIGSKQKSLHLCAECAAKTTSENPIFEGINLAEMLYNISEEMQLPLPDEVEKKDQDDIASLYICEKCGWDTNDFKNTGRLGCFYCYSTFKDILNESLPNMHKSTIHKGKRIKPELKGFTKEHQSITSKIAELQEQLRECVQREEYEQAAVLRDKINELKGTL